MLLNAKVKSVKTSVEVGCRKPLVVLLGVHRCGCVVDHLKFKANSQKLRPRSRCQVAGDGGCSGDVMGLVVLSAASL